jgi:hypothetical protein
VTTVTKGACDSGQAETVPSESSGGVTTVIAWPETGDLLLSELAKAPGRLALAVDDPEGVVLGAFAARLSVSIYHAGRSLLDGEPPTSDQHVISRLVTADPVIDDLDLLFWRPWLNLDPIGVLRTVARRRPGVLFAWPGTIERDQLAYSTPGRRDWYETKLTDAVVLRPIPTVFPDEAPYTAERFA